MARDVSMAEAAAALGVSRRQVRYAVQTGRMVPYRVRRGHPHRLFFTASQMAEAMPSSPPLAVGFAAPDGWGHSPCLYDAAFACAKPGVRLAAVSFALGRPECIGFALALRRVAPAVTLLALASEDECDEPLLLRAGYAAVLRQPVAPDALEILARQTLALA